MAFEPRKRKDITNDFTVASSQLKPGELIKDDYFTLFEAVGALEIMDPKMDSGYVPPDDTFEAEFDPSAGLEANEIVWIMDQLLCLEIVWLDGYPLSQTIFTSLHVDRLLSPDKGYNGSFYNSRNHPPASTKQDKMVHSVLQSHCVALIKCCQLALHVVQSQTYYEEEDFVTHLFGRDLLPAIGSNAAVDSIKDALRWIADCGLPADITQALTNRCQFRQHLLETLAGDGLHWEELNRLLNLINESHHLAEAVPAAFSEKVQRQLATSTPPRPMLQISFDDAQRRWTGLCHDIQAAYRLTSIPAVIQSSHCLQRAVWQFAYRGQPNALARAQMQDLLFGDNAVRGKVPHFDLLLADMTDLVFAGDALADPQSFQVEVPSDPRHICSSLLRDFMEKAVDEYLNLYRMVCQNRCRTRRTFTQAIAIWDAIQKEADSVDEELLKYSPSMKHQKYQKGNGPLRSWASYHTLRILTWTVQLGFETDIYLPDELGKMYWYVAAFSANRTALLESMRRAVRERKKMCRDGQRELDCVGSQEFLASLVDASQATRFLADALWKFYHLLARVGVVRAPKRDFARADLLYEARMKCYLAYPHGYVEDDIPGPNVYGFEMKEWERTGLRNFSATCNEIDSDLKEAKGVLVSLKKYTPEQAKYVGTEDEWKKEIKQMETTCVAIAVAVSQLKRIREKQKTEDLGNVVECKCEKRYHDWWVIPQLKEKPTK